jgi:hypothetical protein
MLLITRLVMLARRAGKSHRNLASIGRGHEEKASLPGRMNLV